MTALTILALGNVRPDDVAALGARFAPLEQIDLPVPPRDAMALHRAAINRAIDAAASNWILILREREVTDDSLADEILAVAAEENAKAWGYRIRVVPLYAGRPLRLGSANSGEVRLFHKRHYLRFANKGEWDEINVQGTVVRAQGPLHAITFDSPMAHRGWLERTAVPHSALRRVLLFLHDAVAARAFDTNTLHYLWIEAGFDQGRSRGA
ncbi:MAG TPA: hypothetical protein VEZ11_06535 [Thermoanaerobaculia bacterium]|nr:hypothetical protein [Thermoanaerobaculia bacterium]